MGEDNDDEKGRSRVIEYISMTLAVDHDLSDGLSELWLNSDRWTALKGYNGVSTFDLIRWTCNIFCFINIVQHRM